MWRRVVAQPADVKTEARAMIAAGVRSKNGGSSGLLVHFYT